MHRLLISLTITGLCAAADPAPAVTNLVVNGDFTAGWTNWNPHEKEKAEAVVSLQSEDGNTFLRLTKPTQVLPVKRIAIDPAWKKLQVSCRMRASGLIPNTAINYGNARLANSFILPEGKRAYRGIVQLEADTDATKDSGWKSLSIVAEIPAGALEFEVACGNFGKAGEIDYDDIVVTAE
jgi:hypothetical protein